MDRWRQYWFADGGRYSAAIVRIGIAVSVLLSLARLATLSTTEIPGPAELYHPVGIWIAFGSWVPPAGVVVLLWIVAWASTLAMLFGAASRASTAISFLSSVALVSASYASSAAWSHPYNVVFLAQLAFLGARGGDALSVDALVRRLRRLPPLDVACGYQWSIRLVQLAVAMMFAGAAFHKLRHGGVALRWALSDNLRHQLLVHYDLSGVPRSALADWLIDDVWRYRTAALLNLASQLAPLAACIFIRRPIVRALAAAAFVVETLALGFVVGLWNLYWIPLGVVFIGWDRTAPMRRALRPRPLASGFIAAFVALDLATSLVPGLDQRLRLYPFTSFPMFASIRASEPYDEHWPYVVIGDHYAVAAETPLDVAQQRWFDYQHRRLYVVRDPDEVHRRLAALLVTASARYPELRIRAIRHYVTVFTAPAYPASARFDRELFAILGEVYDDGTFRTALGSSGGTVVMAPGTDNVFVVTTVDGERWLVR